MKTSEQIDALAQDLAKAQLLLKNAHKDNKANAGVKGSYHYFDLAQLRDISATILAQNNLMVTQTMGFENDIFVLHTRLLHISGQWLQSTFPLPNVPDRSQVIGSALTYARRYSWSAIIGLHGDKDDDGKAAQDYADQSRTHDRPPTITAKDINPYHKGGGPSEYVSRAPSQLLESLLRECETLDEVDAWWLKHYKTNKDKLNHGSQCQLMENMFYKGVETATDGADLNNFWNAFIKDIEYLGTMKPAEIDHLETTFKAKLVELEKAKRAHLTPLDGG